MIECVKSFRLFVLAALLVAVAAPAVHAQDDRLSRRLDAATSARVQLLVDSAARLGLPTERMIQRALQGAAARAPADRIVAAVRGHMEELVSARAVLGVNASEMELTTGAYALEAGIPVSALAQLRAQRPGHELTVSLAVVTDLVANGVPADTATTLVLALSRSGVADEQLQAFQRTVQRDISLGAPPSAAAFTRAVATEALSGANPADATRGVNNPTAPRQVPPSRP
jgi:hypothetical protein